MNRLEYNYLQDSLCKVLNDRLYKHCIHQIQVHFQSKNILIKIIFRIISFLLFKLMNIQT